MIKSSICYYHNELEQSGASGAEWGKTHSLHYLFILLEIKSHWGSGAGFSERESGKKGLTHFVYRRFKKWGKQEKRSILLYQNKLEESGATGAKWGTAISEKYFFTPEGNRSHWGSGAGFSERESGKIRLTHFVYRRFKKWGKQEKRSILPYQNKLEESGATGAKWGTAISEKYFFTPAGNRSHWGSGAGVLKRERGKIRLTHFVYRLSNERSTTNHDTYRRR